MFFNKSSIIFIRILPGKGWMILSINIPQLLFMLLVSVIGTFSANLISCRAISCSVKCWPLWEFTSTTNVTFYHHTPYPILLSSSDNTHSLLQPFYPHRPHRVFQILKEL